MNPASESRNYKIKIESGARGRSRTLRKGEIGPGAGPREGVEVSAMEGTHVAPRRETWGPEFSTPRLPPAEHRREDEAPPSISVTPTKPAGCWGRGG